VSSPSPGQSRPEAPLEVHEIRDLAVRGIAALGVRSLAIRVMGFAANLLLARLLTPHQFGLMAFGLAIIGIGAFITDGGLGAALLRAEETPRRRTLEALLGVQLLLACTATVLIAAVAAPFGGAGAVAAVMALSLPLDCARVPGSLMSERRLDYRPIVRAEVAEMVVYNVVAVGLVALGAGVWGLAAAVPCRALAGTIVLAQQSRVFVRPRLDLDEVRPLYAFGLRLQGMGLVSMIRDQGVNFATAWIAGASGLGKLSFAQRLTQPIWLLFEGSWRVSYPAMSRLRDAGADLPTAVVRALRVASATTGLGVVAIAAGTPAGVPALFGDKWQEVVPIMPLVLGALCIGGPLLTCGTGLLATVGETDKLLRFELVSTVVALVLGIPLLVIGGVVGMAVAIVVATIAGDVYLAAQLSRHGI
jgi:O-antigen/teichoic acid export membrane protein